MITNILNAYIGDASISRIYQGEELVYENSHPDILLTYIANGADDASANPDVYFTTGVAPQLYTKVEFKFEASTIADGRIFGCGNATTATTMYNFNMYGSGTTQEGGTKKSMKFFYRGGNISASITPEANTPYTVTLFGTYSGNTASEINMIINGTKYTRSMSASANITDAASAWIFRWNGNQEPSRPSGVKFYYLKMWNDNRLVRFFVPVLHWLNGQYVPCFYDKVTDIYVYNLGTDTPTYKIHGDYLLDYLGSSPETVIPNTAQLDMRYDSGVVASNQLQVDAKGRLVWGKENYLFGSATSNQTTPTWQVFGYCTPGGSTDADKMRLIMGFGANETSNYNLYISSDSSTVIGVNTLSMYYNTERGLYYLNGVSGNTSSPVPNTFASNTIHMFSRHGDASKINASAGSRIYYINFTTSNIPTKTYVPVFHNNQAAFLDLNSGTYIYNMGTQIPYYQFKS